MTQEIKNINEKISSLIHKYPDDFEYEIEDFLDSFLYKNSFDVKIALKLTVLVLQSPILDFGKGKELLEKLYSCDSNNLNIITLLFYYDCILMKDYSNEVLYKVEKTDTNNKLDKGLILFMKSHYYKNEKRKMISILEKSIKLNPYIVKSYSLLGDYYTEERDILKAKLNYEKAVNKVIKVYEENEFYNPVDVEEFIRENVLQIHLSKVNFQLLHNKLR